MKKIVFFTLFLFMIGCSQQDVAEYENGSVVSNVEQSVENKKDDKMLSSELNAEDYFTENKDADIFQLNGVIFYNIEDTLYSKDGELSLGEYVGEITSQSMESKEFMNGTASKLPVGTKIHIANGTYSENVKIYLAIVDGKKIPYLYRIEG